MTGVAGSTVAKGSAGTLHQRTPTNDPPIIESGTEITAVRVTIGSQ